MQFLYPVFCDGQNTFHFLVKANSLCRCPFLRNTHRNAVKILVLVQHFRACLILKKVDSQTYKKMYYLHAESQEKYFEDVIRLHKSGCSNGAISRLLPVSKTTVSKWISIFVREKGLIMRVKRTEKLVEPDGESAMERLSKENSEMLALIAADSQMFMA